MSVTAPHNPLRSFLKTKASFEARGLLAAVLLAVFSLGSAAWAGDRGISWDHLDLSPDQTGRMERLESEWKQTYSTLSPQIDQDRAQLKMMLSQPNSDPQQVLELQTRIMEKKMQLHNAAMRTYLKKKEQLTPEQRFRLQKMVGH